MVGLRTYQHPCSYSGYSSSETTTSLASQKTPRTSLNPKFTTVFTTARQLPLSWAR